MNRDTGSRTRRWPDGAGLLGWLVLGFSALVWAQSGGRLILPAVPEDLPVEELFGADNAWRETPAAQYGWRPPPREEGGRIKLGYDSVWDKQRLERERANTAPRFELESPGTATLFRYQF